MLKWLRRVFAGPGAAAAKGAPVSLPIHPDDQDLINQADLEWFSGQTVADIQAVSTQDQTFQLATFRKFTDEGLSPGEAALKCRKYFPYYYYSLEVRRQDKWQEKDALLPFHVKDRVNRAALGFKKTDVEAASTMNAFIRHMIRSRQM